MKPLRNAVEDYIALRRSLGFKLRDTATCLTEFAAFLEEKQAPYITTALALEWAMQPVNHQPKRLGPPSRLRPRVRSPLERNRSAHRDSGGRFAPVSSAASPSLSVHRGGDSKTAGCRQEPFTRGRPSTSDLSLFIGVVSSQWAPHQRGNQIGAARRRFRPRTPHHSPSQVQQDPFDSAPYFYPGGLHPIRRMP
jgi:hypothetical protein